MTKINKDLEIQKHLDAPYEIGETVYIRGLHSQDKNVFSSTTKIIDLYEDGVVIKEYDSLKKVPFNDVQKYTHDIGYYPFDKNANYPRSVNFGIDSILSITLREREYKNDNGIMIQPMNWNPFVTINGEKKYYQRDFVWELSDKQSLIDSIYNEMDCGKIVVRKYEWDEIAKETDPEKCYFNDIIDGKQRLSTINEFINDGFVDSKGYLFSELSTLAKRQFMQSQSIVYMEYKGYVSDEDILKQFLMINFKGVPQSKEHIDFVTELLKEKRNE